MDSLSNADTLTFLESGNSRLAYRTVGPVEESDLGATHVVFCGGFHSTMLGTKASALEHICLSHGLSYTRFDYRGHGESEGDADTTNLNDWLEDTLAILATIDSPVLLIGSSMGGWLAVLAAMRLADKIAGLLLIASAPDFLQELVQPRLSTADAWDLQQGQTIQLASTYNSSLPIHQSLLDSGVALSLFKPIPPANHYTINNITCPIRLIHGTGDVDVPFELSVRLMEEFTRAKSQLTLLRQANHRLSDEMSLAIIESELLNLARDIQP